MDTQYETIEKHKENIGRWCCNMTTITLFLWGQTGYNHGAKSYMPNDTNTGASSFYAYGQYTNNLYDYTGQADWGYVVITNGGNANKQWRTLKADEWEYLFTQRPGAEQKYGRALIDGTHRGVVVLPDNWVEPYDNCFTGGSDVSCEDNSYTISQWIEMEEAGAVFFPYAGYRFEITAKGANQYSFLWSSSAYNYYKYAYMVNFYDKSFYFKNYSDRNLGCSVRLVCE